MANVIVEKDPSAVVDLHQNSWMADISKADNSTQPLLRGDPYLVEAVERGAILVGRCVSPDPEELFQENISDTTSLVSSHPEWNDSEAAISPHTASTAATPGLADRKDSPLDKLWENLETDSATSNDFLPRDCLQCELKGLPCSKTRPSCGRCLRCGHREPCLAQTSALSEGCDARTARDGRLISLLCLNEDTDETWSEKLGLRARVSFFFLQMLSR